LRFQSSGPQFALIPAQAGIERAQVFLARTKPLSSPRRRGPITTPRLRLSLVLPHGFAAAYGSPPSRGRQRRGIASRIRKRESGLHVHVALGPRLRALARGRQRRGIASRIRKRESGLHV